MPIENFDHYNIYRGPTESGPFVLIGTSETESFTDSTAEPMQTYCYYVTAVDIYDNETEPSSIDCVTLLPVVYTGDGTSGRGQIINLSGA